MEITANGENQEYDLSTRAGQIYSLRHNIDECKRYVLSIQRRLDKAVANGDRPRIKWYSHILAKRSRAVKVLAVNESAAPINQGHNGWSGRGESPKAKGKG